jgi:DNA invertase Pin-like site-specific DNA recombinase
MLGKRLLQVLKINALRLRRSWPRRENRQIDAILVTELTRWGRSNLDLVHTLHDLQSWNVSLIAQSGLEFDLSTSQGKLIASLMADRGI